MITVSTERFVIRRTTEADWRRLRELRLELVADEPLAYHQTLADARRTPEGEWRKRAARGSSERSATFAAVAPDGHWLGSMTAFVPRDSHTAELVAVFVRAPYRGRRHGVTDALLQAVERWAARRGSVLALEVNETNIRARRAYRSRGFTETGARSPHPLAPHLDEIEMVKPLEEPEPSTGVTQAQSVNGR